MSPAALRAQAARLRATAASLPRALVYVVAATGPDVWRGPAAKAFEAELDRREKHLRQCSEELEEVSRRLLKMADSIEERERVAGAAAA
jgi:uncharacterized protein YukE